MLQVHSGSWHYWIWRLGRSNHSRPRNLCKYFWHIVLKVVAFLIVVGLALTGVGSLLWLIITHPTEFFGMTALVAIGIGVVIGALWLGGILYERHLVKKELRKLAFQKKLAEGWTPPPKKKRKPSVVMAFLRARKAKYCPLIEVVDTFDETG